MSKSIMQRDEMIGLEVVHPNAAGIYIGNAAHYVAVPPDRDGEQVRTFECFTKDPNKMAGWLAQCGIVTVAKQSTGVYWLPEALSTTAKQLDAEEVQRFTPRHHPHTGASGKLSF